MTNLDQPVYIVPAGVMDDLRAKLDDSQKRVKSLEARLAEARDRVRFLGLVGPAEEAVAGAREVSCYAVARADMSDQSIVEATCPQWAADAYADARSLDPEDASVMVRRAATVDVWARPAEVGRAGLYAAAQSGAACPTAPVRYRGDRAAHVARLMVRASILAVVVR